MKKKRKMIPEVICPYCGKKAVLRPASYLYADKKIFDPDGMFYVCSGYPDCDAYVSANKKNQKPLGKMANGELRHLRIEAHRALREIWQRGYMTQASTYHWLSAKMGLHFKETHIAKFNTYFCEETIRLAHELIAERENGKEVTKVRSGGKNCRKERQYDVES